MLTAKSIEKGAELAQAATARGRCFTLRDGSALDVILSTTQPANYPAVEKGGYQSEVRRMAMPINSAFDPHTAENNRIAEGMGERLAANIRFTRNVVNQLVRETVSECMDVKRTIETDSPLNINIRHVGALSIFNSASLDAGLEQFRVGNFPRLSISLKLRGDILSNLTIDIMHESLKAAFESQTAAINEIFEHMDKEGRSPINRLFEEATIPLGSSRIFEDATNIINYLFLEALLANKVSTFNMSEVNVTVRAELTKAHAFYGNRLARQINQMRDIAKAGNFVLPAESTKKNLEVYDKAYRNWLNNGGTSEALIAAVSTLGSLASINGALRNDTEGFEKKYKRMAANFKMESRVVASHRLESVIETKVLTYINTEHPEQDRRESVDALRAFLKHNRLQSNTDLLEYIRRCVCESIGNGTNAYQLLSDIDTYMEIHEDATMAQAAVYAAGRLIAQWLAAQVKVVECKGEGFNGTNPEPPVLL